MAHKSYYPLFEYPSFKVDEINKDSSSQMAKRILHTYVKKHKSKISIAIFCMLIAAGMTAANALMLKPVIDEIFLNKNAELLFIIPFAIFVIAVVKGLAIYVQSVIMKIVGQRVTTDMQTDLYKHLIHSDIAMFSDNSSGNLVSRFTNDINIIRKNFSNVLIGFAKESITLVLLVGVMFYQSIELALLGFVVFPIAIYPIIRLGKRMRKVTNKTQEELANFTSQLDDTFKGVRIVKAYAQEDMEIKRAKTTLERLFELYVKAAKTESASSPIMESLAGIAIASVIYYGGHQVLEGETTPGEFFSFIAALLMAYKPLKSISRLNTNLQEALSAVKRLFTALDAEASIKDSENAQSLIINNEIGAEIEFKEVNFSYNPKAPALNGININIPKRKMVALVGASGSGKSTIMNMILRFYDTDGGNIEINGQNIKGITMKSLRDNIAIVNQEATLFDASIKENIAYGKENASDEEIFEAAKLASAHDFIKEQPKGYDTQIGQSGLKLSGGQRQRIAIARAMLRNAPILLLDEATSALDTVSEKQVQEALENLMEGRTTIVVAHRLSTIMNADIIYVISEGQAVESGSHKGLLKKKGKYFELYERQFSE